ncbi:MAG: esterase/lipase family protein [Mycobacterium sp.]|uniref:esterase/lipase family protein n=1 Tax=Mycobacterium sp. TaxID=1785 RepID=UPI003899B38A
MSRSFFYWWLRFTVAAFVLSAWVAVGVGSGLAQADEAGPSGGDSTSENSPAPKASKPDSPKRSVAAHDHDTTSDAATESSSPADESTEPAEKPAASSDPDDPPQPHARRNSHRPGLTAASAKPAKPAKPVADDPKPSAIDATSHRAAVALTTPTPDPQPVAAKIAAIAPAVSSTQSGGNTISAPQPRQVIGLASDVGVVAASAVYTVANTVAQAFGPHSFFGVPYALATAVANSAAAVSRTLIGAPAGAASSGPFPVTYGLIDGLAFFNPQKPPPGANDPSITVTAEHPLPIILVNGTIATQGENWGVGAPVLANAGYKVYTFNYGNITQDPNFPIQATDDIRQSGLQLAAEVDRVLAETGAPKVILIGHSQGGGILPVYYINNLGGADKVSQLIGIAPSNHGTDADGLIGVLDLPILGPILKATVNIFGQALLQQTLGSEFQQEVYGNGDTRPGVLYTTIASMNDEVVTPYTQQALNGPNVTNIVLQDLYPGLPAGHLGVVLSPQVWFVVLDALASNPAANPLQIEELAA